MERYETIKKELKSLNLIDLDGISENIVNKLIKEKIKKKELSNTIITLSFISITVLIITLIGRRIWKK